MLILAYRLLKREQEVELMLNDKHKKTSVVMMSPGLMKLYEVYSESPVIGEELFNESDYHPITFYDPQECLDMMTEEELEEEYEHDAPVDMAEKREKKWGELELRLSFFTDSYRWQ